MNSGNPGEVPQPEDVNRAKQAADLLPAYTLDALDADERILVEQELAAAELLRDEHRRYDATVDSLASPTTLVSPPAALRGRVLALMRPVPIASQRSMLSRVALGLAAALVLILAGLVAVLWSELNERENQINDLQQEQATSRPPTNFSQPLVWTDLRAAMPGMPGSGYFCRTEDGSVGWIVVEGMPVTADYVYQLWLVDGDRLESAGMFVTDAEGRGFGVVRASTPVTGFEQLWITTEPPGGSLTPSGDPQVSVTIV